MGLFCPLRVGIKRWEQLLGNTNQISILKTVQGHPSECEEISRGKPPWSFDLGWYVSGWEPAILYRSTPALHLRHRWCQVEDCSQFVLHSLFLSIGTTKHSPEHCYQGHIAIESWEDRQERPSNNTFRISLWEVSRFSTCRQRFPHTINLSGRKRSRH